MAKKILSFENFETVYKASWSILRYQGYAFGVIYFFDLVGDYRFLPYTDSTEECLIVDPEYEAVRKRILTASSGNASSSNYPDVTQQMAAALGFTYIYAKLADDLGNFFSLLQLYRNKAIAERYNTREKKFIFLIMTISLGATLFFAHLSETEIWVPVAAGVGAFLSGVLSTIASVRTKRRLTPWQFRSFTVHVLIFKGICSLRECLNPHCSEWNCFKKIVYIIIALHLVSFFGAALAEYCFEETNVPVKETKVKSKSQGNRKHAAK